MYKPRRRRIYLAARFGRQSEMRDVRDKLTYIGYEVLGSWLDEEPYLDGKLSRGQAHQIAELCFYEINKASVLVCFIDNDPKSIRGGHQAEFGYALAKGKILVSVGDVPRNVLHELWRVKQFLSTEEFLQAARLSGSFSKQALS